MAESRELASRPDYRQPAQPDAAVTSVVATAFVIAAAAAGLGVAALPVLQG